ncbi:MAG: 6-phosphogluconolactonase [Gammaproteobacteria bacterium]|nr:MAG: 6-phosphogluconolactonase [Gammaproteobacteria bacterium]
MATKSTDNSQLKVFHDMGDLCQSAAADFADMATIAVNDHGAFHVALSGGTTPRHLHNTLCNDKFRNDIPWKNLHIYWGDERAVALDHPDSNYRMARESLLDHVPIPQDQIYPMITDPNHLLAEADKYDALLRSKLPNGSWMPVFDLVLLGLGTDGHTASLFPDTDILKVRDRCVCAVYVVRMDTWRISLTLPMINAATHAMILVSGKGKADIVYDVFMDTSREVPYPVQWVHPRDGISWYLDKKAVSRLMQEGST